MHPPHHLRRGFAALLVLLVTLGLSACGDDTTTADRSMSGLVDDDATLAGVVRTPPLEVAGVTLPDVANGGQPAAMTAPPGELYLIYFGYTSCPDICPTTLSDLRVALNDLPDELAARVRVGMATVDPERDSDVILTGYLGHFFDDPMALRTDDPAALEAATEAFGVRYEIEEHEPGTSYEVSHSAVTYVIDDSGTVVVEWPFGFDSRDMSADLTKLLTKESR